MRYKPISGKSVAFILSTLMLQAAMELGECQCGGSFCLLKSMSVASSSSPVSM